MSVTFQAVNSKGETITEMVDRGYGPENNLELNVANGNAITLLRFLGVARPEEGDDLTGEITDVATFERACLDHLNVLRAEPALDAGRKDQVLRGEGGATVVMCAMSDGYLTERISKLRELAELALLSGGKLIYYYSTVHKVAQ